MSFEEELQHLQCVEGSAGRRFSRLDPANPEGCGPRRGQATQQQARSTLEDKTAKRKEPSHSRDRNPCGELTIPMVMKYGTVRVET